MTAHAKVTGALPAGLLDDLAAARERCEVNAQLAQWVFELQGRVWHAEAHLLHDDCRRHHATLATEVERLKLCIALAKKAWGAP
jgi:hypothetical protein